MANVDNPHGFRPLGRNLYGGASEVVAAHKLVTYGTALFIYDAVCKAATGTKKTPCIDAAITPGTTPVFGVNLVYGAASAATDHLVIPSLGNVFECQDDGDAPNGLVAADMAKNANISLGAGNAATLISGHELDEDTANTTNTLDLHILGLLDVPDNAFGAHARVEVMFNRAALANQTVGI